MREDLDKKLCADFPNLYKDRNGDMQDTCMCWGFPRTGWHDLIRECSEKIEKLILALPDDERKNYRAVQVKEKFGTLRFYMSSETEEMSKAIEEAENKSCVTCEECGQPGKSRSGGWIKTLCDKCNDVQWITKNEE